MLKQFVLLCFVLLNSVFVFGDRKVSCDRCVPIDKCSMVGEMTRSNQEKWIQEHPCKGDDEEDMGPLFGFAPSAKGDYVCCPSLNVWGVESPSKTEKFDKSGEHNGNNDDSGYYHDNLHHEQNDHRGIDDSQEVDDVSYEKNKNRQRNHRPRNNRPRPNYNNNFGNPRGPGRSQNLMQGNDGSSRNTILNNPNFNNPGVNRPIGNPNFNNPINRPIGNGPNYNIPNPNSNRPIGNDPNFNIPNPNGNRPIGNDPNFNIPNPNGNRPIGNDPNFNIPNPNGNRPIGNDPNFINSNGNRPIGNGPFNRPVNNPNFNNGRPNIPDPYSNTPIQGPVNGPNSRANGPGVGRQCPISSFPPDYQSGCCGLDVSSDGRSNSFLNRPSNWNSPRRFTRENPEDFGISLDNRIAGGKETNLYQFPWTVLLKTTFDYGDKKGTFNCGGSLISSRYVLTAAHCVTEPGAKIDHIDVYLAEFDKRTFPRDCVSSPEGQKCIENILTQAEGVISHQYYDDTRLQNDIALVRLRENVAYTEFTRPICLPPINIDRPEYSDLRLAVAGWGRNGSLTSDVKQSTVVNLVPQRQCSSSYPHLTENHVCAAGKTGEDTCKGDSGGPLMMLYEGKYYVSGVVSGKRADAPCGTSVPSLYTNVFQYVDWIRENMRN